MLILTIKTGPTLLTVGPWRPVSLHAYYTRISDLHISAQVDKSLDADLIIRIALFPQEVSGAAEVLLKDPSGSVATSQSGIEIKGGTAQAMYHFAKGDVKLWYPVGYGEQPLYDVQVNVFDNVRPSFSGENLFIQVIVAGRAVTGYQDPKDRVPPRARR